MKSPTLESWSLSDVLRKECQVLKRMHAVGCPESIESQPLPVQRTFREIHLIPQMLILSQKAIESGLGQQSQANNPPIAKPLVPTTTRSISSSAVGIQQCSFQSGYEWFQNMSHFVQTSGIQQDSHRRLR